MTETQTQNANTSNEEYTLFLVKAQTAVDNPDISQAALVEHPPDSKQAQIIQTAMEEVAERSTNEKAEVYAVETQTGPPEKLEAEYEKYEWGN
jgi:hypothetical protein